MRGRTHENKGADDIMITLSAKMRESRLILSLISISVGLPAVLVEELFLDNFTSFGLNAYFAL